MALRRIQATRQAHVGRLGKTGFLRRHYRIVTASQVLLLTRGFAGAM